MSDPSEQLSDLDWLAFRYVAGELTADEALRFEHTLAEDQAAREAVAAAVELGSAVCSVYAQPIHQPSIDRSPGMLRPAAWMSVGAAVSLAIVLAWQIFGGDHHGAGGNGGAVAGRTADDVDGSRDAGLLAAAWAQAGLDAELDEQEGWLAPDVALFQEEANTEGEVIETPEWLLAAVADDEPDMTVPKEPNES